MLRRLSGTVHDVDRCYQSVCDVLSTGERSLRGRSLLDPFGIRRLVIGARTVPCHRWLLGLAIAGAGLTCLSLFGASAASAQTFEVTETKGPKGLVEAVAKANTDAEANTIVLAGGTYVPTATLTLTNTAGPQTIEGPTSLPVARLTGSSVEPFPSELLVVKAGVSVNIKDVVLTIGGGLGVPAIVDSGSLTLEASTVSGNKGPQVIVESVGTATARNSTISDGSDFGVIDHGTASFFNSTVAFNKNGGIESTGTLNLTNTIVAENTGSGDCAGAATTSDHSLDSDGSCGVGALGKTNPLLQKELLNDGGSTPVHSLKPGSPAIDAGDKATCLATSQEGQPRPDVSGTACDIGADEYNEVKPTLKVPANITTTATSAEGAEINYTVEATTPVSVIRTLECLNEKNLPAPSGSVFPIGTTTVTCTAIDGHENKTSGSFTITVNPQAKAPTVETKPASAVTQTTATLNGTVNPNGGAVSECTFDYGTTTAYGKTAPCSALPGSGTSPVAVSAAITGLAPNTTYDFKLVARNAGGPGEGANETLKTEPEEAKEVVSPAEAIEQLLKEVGAAPIPHGIRARLSRLLEAALRDLEHAGSFGPHASADTERLGQLGLRAGRESRNGHGHERAGGRACLALRAFIDVITDDQARRRPRIPADLASTWIQAAENIGASLGCPADQEPADQEPGDSERR
jgi:hypothetical protein